MTKRPPQYKIGFCLKRGLFLLVTASLFCQCQNKYRFPKDMPPIPESKEIVPECGWFGTMRVEEQRKTFPFNEAAKILLISYANYEHRYISSPSEDSVLTPWGEKLPPPSAFTNAKKTVKPVVLSHFSAFGRVYSAYEIVGLTQQQTDSLSHLAFNFKSQTKVEGGTRSVAGCYTPRNSILFLDKNDKPILVLEVCFECHQIYFYPEDKHFDAFDIDCRSSELVKAFFKQCNVHFGVD